MKIISIVGKADKRILTYPLLKVLALTGKTLVLTDDVAYRRLYPGKNNEGSIQDVDIRILPLTEEKIQTIISELPEESYNFVIIITDTERYMDADRTLVVCSKNKSFMGVKLAEFTEKEPDAIKVFFSSGEVNKKEWAARGVIALAWNEGRYKYAADCEECQTLLPFADKEVLAVLESAFIKDLDITSHALIKAAKRKIM